MTTGWRRTAVATHPGHVRSGGVDRDVTFADVSDPGASDRLDTAYRSKCGRFGGAYVDPIVAARGTTLRLLPR